MEKMYLLILICGVLHETWFTSEAAVFLSREAAGSVLARQKRYNTGAFEELKKDNLERECLEEKCSLEEAREVYEDNEKTREFWVGYTDGNQCLSSPCLNNGKCEDGMSAYVCWCPPGFHGKNCELEMARLCQVDNGGCMQFCMVDKTYGTICDCADGYRLAEDNRSCEPIVNFPCGRLGKEIATALDSFRSINEENVQQTQSVNHPNMTERNHTAPINTTQATLSSAPSQPTKAQPWPFFPTLPTIKNQTNNQHRIVGGSEALPGEIPWQVALIVKISNITFCGGALLSDVWVITAAHCLDEVKIGQFHVRVGEHNVKEPEGRESDHEIAEHHVHSNYNFQRSYNHDIALLKLQTPVKFSYYALPICLGPIHFTEKLLSIVPHSLVSGWGRIRFGGKESDTLQKVEVPFVDRTECKSSAQISRFMFCAGYSTIRKDSCQGDSGGPHATSYRDTWFLTGIISWGDECAKEGKYGIYTRVSKYMTWITNITGIRAGSS
ncbi:coagulation factor IXb [Electrophorus electricus]|uniref:coagulation factor IXb n=1 Tax=Electrophorus electricus TaxID=8005 RepID=UPI0015CF83DA|nr:coagulation factor IXb [Electrophorus electricus]